MNKITTKGILTYKSGIASACERSNCIRTICILVASMHIGSTFIDVSTVCPITRVSHLTCTRERANVVMTHCIHWTTTIACCTFVDIETDNAIAWKLRAEHVISQKMHFVVENRYHIVCTYTRLFKLACMTIDTVSQWKVLQFENNLIKLSKLPWNFQLSKFR